MEGRTFAPGDGARSQLISALHEDASNFIDAAARSVQLGAEWYGGSDKWVLRASPASLTMRSREARRARTPHPVGGLGGNARWRFRLERVGRRGGGAPT